MTDTSGVTPEVIDELKRRREERDRANAALVNQRNQVLETAPPDDAAYDLAKSKELNLPREAIAADRDRYKQEDSLARFERMRTEAPKVSAWLAAPENFAVARDDVDTLVSTEKQLDPWLTPEGGRLMDISKTWNSFFGNVGGAARAALPGWKAQAAGLGQQQLESLGTYNAELDAFEKSRNGSIKFEVGGMSVSLNPAWFGVGDPRPEAPIMAKLMNLEDPGGLVIRQPGEDKFREEARRRYDAVLKPLAAEAARIGAEASAEQKALMPQTGDFVADSLLSGVTSFVNMAPSIAGFLVGGPTTGASIMGGQVLGQQYGEGRNEYGLEPTLANERAIGHALVETVSERISLGILDDILQSTAPLWKKMLTGMAAEQVQEQAASLGGDAIDWATVNQEKTLNEFIAERPGRAAQTALATLVASGGMQGTVLAIDYGTRAFMRDAVAAQPTKGDKLLDGLLTDASKSKLRSRTPEKAAELAEMLTKGADAETVVIDLDGLAQSLEAAGLDVMEAMTEMGIPADAISETAIVMGQVEVPTARLMVSNGVQTHRDKVQPHMRLKGEDLTPAQKEAIGAEASNQAAKFSEAIREDVARDADFAGQIAEVEDQVATQLRDAGFSGQTSVLRANAVLASRMAAYVAKKRGQDVRDVWGEIGPTIVGSFGEAGTTDVLRQAEEAGYQGSDRGEAKSWLRGMAKFGPEGMTTEARMARAKEMGFDTETVLYRGTANFDGAQLDGVVFTSTDPEVGAAYAFRKARRRYREEGPTVEEQASLDALASEREQFERARKNPFMGKARRNELRDKQWQKKWEGDATEREFTTLRGGQIMPLYGRAKNPMTVDGSDLDPTGDMDSGEVMRDLIAKARAAGHDGVIVKGWHDSWSDKVTDFHILLDPSNIRSVHAAFDPDQSASADLLAQSIRQVARMDMAEVKQWVIDNVTSTESDFPNGDVLTVMKFPLTEDAGAPEVMLSIRLKETADKQRGRADVNLFLEGQMADALEAVEDVAQRGTLAKIMFAKSVMVMRQYAAEYDVKAFNFIAAESQAEGTKAKSREALYRYMLSTLKMDGYTAYELDSQMSVVREQDGEKSADPLFPGSGFVVVKDGVDVEEFARNEIIRGTQRGGDVGEVVTVLTAKRLGRADTGDRGGRGRGGVGAAPDRGDEDLNQLIGPRAKGANKAILNTAKKMAKERVKTGPGLLAKTKPKYTRQQIWDETAKLGQPWYQDKNGDWISEIEDGSIVVKDAMGPMGEVIEMPSIYEQYPEFAKKKADARDKARVKRETGKEEPGGVGGWYQDKPFLFGVNIRIISRGEQAQYTTTHEVQHAVDYAEGRKLGLKKEYYLRDTERRAFNTMYRRLWTMQERIATPPWKTEQEAVSWWGALRSMGAPEAQFTKEGTPDPGGLIDRPDEVDPTLPEKSDNVPDGAESTRLEMPDEAIRTKYFDEQRQRQRTRMERARRFGDRIEFAGRTFLSFKDVATSMVNNPRIRQIVMGEARAQLTAEEAPAFTDALMAEVDLVAAAVKKMERDFLDKKGPFWEAMAGTLINYEADTILQYLEKLDIPLIRAGTDLEQIATTIALNQYDGTSRGRFGGLEERVESDALYSGRLEDVIRTFRGEEVKPKPMRRGTNTVTAEETKKVREALEPRLMDMGKTLNEQAPAVAELLRTMIAEEQARPSMVKYGYDTTQPGYFDGMPVGKLLRELASAMENENMEWQELHETAMQAIYRRLAANGIVGAKYVPGGTSLESEVPQTQSIVIFDERAPVLLTDPSGNLLQERRGGYSPATKQMVFTEARDVSTFMHETAHWFLDTVEKLAPTEAWAAADLAEIDSWYQGVRDTPKMAAIRARYGVVPTAEGWQVTYDGQPMERPRATEAEALARIEWRERQEAFAESFEEYLMTGKAPAPKLLGVFRAFRDWLVNLYKGMLPGERANLNPAIQAVFDRVLTVDTEVDAASSEAFRDADTMAKDMLVKGVITERQYRMVGERLNKAREEVKEEMIARALKEEMRTREDWWAKEKARVKGDLARAFDKSEVGRAFNWLAYGEWKGDVVGEPATEAGSEVEEEAYGALFQNRGEIVSEAQVVAAREFDDEADRIFSESEFQYDMLDEELAKITADIDAQIEALKDRDLVDIAAQARAAFIEPRLAALDPESDTYDEDVDALEAEADQVDAKAFEAAMDAQTEEDMRLEDAKAALEETETERLQEEAERQIEEYRTRAITELVDRFEATYGSAALLKTRYQEYSGYDSRDRFIVSDTGDLRPIEEFFDDGNADSLSQTRIFNPPGHGSVPPPPNVPPVRLDLRIVKDLYGEEAVRKLPAAVRRRSSTSSNVTDMLAMIETVRKTLAKKKKGPQTLTQFIMKQKRKDANGVMTGGLNGIKGASAELKAMGLERLINEKSGTLIDYVREAAEEAGFIRPAANDANLTREAGDLDATPNDLLDALAREARGEAVVRIEDEGVNQEMTDARTWATWLEQNGVDIYEADKKKLRASVEAMLSATDESLVSPDQAAELFGFANGEELLAALAEVGNRDKFLDAQADRALANEYGDMMKDGTLIEEAREAARLSILGRQSEIELEALSRAVGQQASTNYAKRMARDIIALRTVKEIAAYERDLDNERRFSKQALAAVSKGDYAAALKAKQRQIIAAQMYREGKKAHERIEKQRRDLMNYLTSEGRREKIANDYLERIDAVLDDYELRVSKQGPSVQKARQSAAAYVAWMTEQGREAEIAPEAMLLATQANLKTWRNLTADEVDYLVGTIENMAHLGRTKQRLLNDKEKRQREAILDELTATLAAAPSAKTSRERSFTPTVGEGAATWLRKAHARLTRMEFQFARLDGREGGPLHTALFQPFADAADRETSRMREAAVRMQDLYAAFTTGERSALFNRRISTPELKVPGKGLTLMDAVVIGLNWGNAGNRQALIDGYGWEPAAIEAMLNRVLTDKHWDFIEGVWDLIGSYRDDAFALEKSITGVAPKAVEGATFTLANGRKIEGKYYPLKYDSGQARADSVRQARLDEKQMLSEMGKSFSKPMTKTGHLIERVGSGGKPVKLSIGVFHEHVASVIHDIAYRRSIIDVYKLVTSPRFADAYIQAAGREQYDTLVPWIAQIANERKDEPGGYVTDLLRGARRNFSIMAMGLKVGTAVQQATGVLQAVPLIGSRYAAQGFFKAIGGGPASFWSAWNWVSQKSEFMRDRPMGFDRDVREVTNKLQERTPLGAVRRNAFILIGVMDTAVSTGVWIGAYDKALDGNVPGMDKGDEEAAIAYADSIVRRSQVAGRMQDLPQMMRGTELEKLMTVVYSYFSGLYNETASEVLRVRGGQLNPLAFSANMTLLYVVIPLIASALAGRLFAEDDDDELDEKIGKEIASNAVSTVPFVRDIINATINPQFGYQLSPAGSIIEGGTKAAANIATGEGFETEYATKQTLNLMGLLFGLPTGQLWITGEYAYDVATGQEAPAEDPADAAREALLRDTR